MTPTPDAGVRPARPEDAGPIAAVQVRAWRTAYADVLTAAALAELTGPAAEEQFTAQWRRSVERPPSSHHHVLVATAGPDLTGVAAYAPCTDDDRWARTDAELLTLTVDPDRRGEGHGSRLLNASVDLLREDGYRTVSSWVLTGDLATRAFLESSGWAADGSTRGLDAAAATDGRDLQQVRLVTTIG